MTPDTTPSPDGTQWDALARYFSGEMSELEAAELRRWVAADPGRAEQVERLRKAWDVAGRLRGEWDTEAALGQMLPPTLAPVSKRGLVVRPPMRPVVPTPASMPWRRAVGWAAVAVIVLGAGIGLRRAGAFGHRPSMGAGIASAEVTTRRGQRASLRLPDGTDVVLGPGSKIRYAMAGSQGTRVVSLDGEAYFRVTHDAERPFTVRTSRAVVTDLGTRFDVRAYPEDSTVSVAVAEGTVSLRPASASREQRDSVLLVHGDLGRVTAAGHLVTERAIAIDRYFDWTDGRLVFRDTPVREAVAQLSRWYDLDIRLGDSSLGGKRVTARFKKEPATQAVGLIAASLGLQVEAHDSVLILRTR